MARKTNKVAGDPDAAKRGDPRFGRRVAQARRAANPESTEETKPSGDAAVRAKAIRVRAKELADRRNAKKAGRTFSPTEKSKKLIGADHFFKSPETAHIGNVMVDIHTHAQNGDHHEASKTAELLQGHLFGAEEDHRSKMNDDYDNFNKHWEAKKEKKLGLLHSNYKEAKAQADALKGKIRSGANDELDRPDPQAFERRSIRQQYASAQEDRDHHKARYESALDNHEHEFGVAKAKKHNDYYRASKGFRDAHALVAQHAPLHKVLNGLEEHPESYAHKSSNVRNIIKSRAEDRLESALESGDKDKLERAKDLHQRAKNLAPPVHNTETVVPKKKPSLFHRGMRALGLREAHLPEGVKYAQEFILEVLGNARRRRGLSKPTPNLKGKKSMRQKQNPNRLVLKSLRSATRSKEAADKMRKIKQKSNQETDEYVSKLTR